MIVTDSALAGVRNLGIEDLTGINSIVGHDVHRPDNAGQINNLGLVVDLNFFAAPDFQVAIRVNPDDLGGE